MPRVTHVLKARKDNRVAKKGEPYYWWKPYGSGKQMSASYPKPSQLCSGRKSEVMATQEGLAESLEANNFDWENPESAFESGKETCEETAEQFREQGQEYNDGADNMPESLQYGEQAENMREMGQSLESAADELDDVEWECPEFEGDDDPPMEDDFEEVEDFELAEESYKEEYQTWLDDCQEALGNAVDSANEAANNVEFMF